MLNTAPLFWPDTEQRDLLRRTAPRCVAFCLPAPAAEIVSPEQPPHCHRRGDGLQAIHLEGMVRRLRRLQQAFRIALSRPNRGSADPRAGGLDLAAFLAHRFIPVVGLAHQWPLAAREAANLIRSLRSPGAVGPRARLLGTIAVMWALVEAHPAVRSGAELSPSGAQRLRHTLAALDLFDGLGQWRPIPPGVRLVAGVLALIAGPPRLRTWVEEARRTAVACRARRLTHLLDSLVTPGGAGPSSW